jgi:hypothetical protein
MRWAAALVIIGGFLAFLAWDIASQGQYECDVCIQFGGRTDCQVGSAATRKEAIQAGQTPACQSLAHGVTEAFACSATPPLSVKCTPE